MSCLACLKEGMSLTSCEEGGLESLTGDAGGDDTNISVRERFGETIVCGEEPGDFLERSMAWHWFNLKGRCILR